MRVIEKVVAYVTRDEYLLVFRHVDFDAGIQVPAGTLELAESPHDGVLWEVEEETGLDGLEVRRFLGVRDYDMSPYGLVETHRRHYFHLECKGDAPSIWRHFESHPSGCLSKRIEFELYWVRLPDEVPELAGEQGDLLGELDRTTLQ